MRVYNKLQHKNGMERSMKVQIRMCRSYPSKIFFTLSLGFLECLFAIVAALLLAAIELLIFYRELSRPFFPLHSLFWSKSKEIFSIHRAQLHMLVTSLSVSLLLSHTLPPHLLLHALSFGCSAATGYLFSPHFMPFLSQYGRSRVWNVPKEFVVQECIMCKTMTNSNRSAVGREKKNDCAPNHRYNLWNLLRKRYIFERRFFSSFSLGIFFMGFSFCRFVQCSIPFGFYLSFLLLFLLSANFLGRFSVCVHSNGKSNGNIARSISPVGNTNLFEARYFCFSLYHFSTKIYEKNIAVHWIGKLLLFNKRYGGHTLKNAQPKDSQRLRSFIFSFLFFSSCKSNQ